jgi:hypothetical protein
MIYYPASYRFDYFCGWRYLVSPAFRHQMLDRWGQSPWMRALCYAGVAASLLITTTVAVLALMAGWHLMGG